MAKHILLKYSLEFPRIHAYTWNFTLLGISFGVWCCCRKGDPFQGLKVGSCLTLWNELSEETHVLTKQEILLGKGTQENCSAVSGFMVMGLVSGLPIANCSDSESFLVVYALYSQDGCQQEGFWEVVGHMVSPFGLSWTLLEPGVWSLTRSDHSPRARHPGMWSQVGLRKHHYKQS